MRDLLQHMSEAGCLRLRKRARVHVLNGAPYRDEEELMAAAASTYAAGGGGLGMTEAELVDAIIRTMDAMVSGKP